MVVSLPKVCKALRLKYQFIDQFVFAIQIQVLSWWSWASSTASITTPASTPSSAPTGPSTPTRFGRWGLGPQVLYPFTTCCNCALFKITFVHSLVIIWHRQHRANCKPTRSDGSVSAKNMQSPIAKTKMFNYSKHFNGFLKGSRIRFFVNYEINVDISMNKTSISRSSDSTFD